MLFYRGHAKDVLCLVSIFGVVPFLSYWLPSSPKPPKSIFEKKWPLNGNIPKFCYERILCGYWFHVFLSSFALRTTDYSENPLLAQFDQDYLPSSMWNSMTPCREWRTWSSKCTDAGNFCLFGISHINTLSPTGNPTTSTGNIATASTQTTRAVLSRSSKAVREPEGSTTHPEGMGSRRCS